MDLLYYNELDYTNVKTQFKKVEKFLANNNFKSAEIKKLEPTDFYRAKLDKTNRLLFKFAKYEGKKYILLLEVILNHEYEKSKFLRGAQVDDEKIITIETPEQLEEKDVKELIFLNKKKKQFNVLDKIISFDDIQEEIYALPTPLTIIGSAGSGKTILTLEKLKKLSGNIAYISLSQFLVENAQNIYYSNNYENNNQEIDFLSFQEYIKSIKIPKGAELTYKVFEEWFLKHNAHLKLSEPYRLYEEFKGVLTGSIVKSPYMSEEDYLNLGIKQSIFTAKQRKEIYSVFLRYLDFLNESSWYDMNMLSFEYLSLVENKYDFVVIDEVQDITNIQLKLILSALKNKNNFILSGDSNQIVHPNFFSWSKIKTLFFKSDYDFTLIRILTTNYRNSKKVTELSNLLLKIKNARFGSIDKESTYLIDTVSEKEGEVFLLKNDKKKLRSLNSKTQNSTKFAVLVMSNIHKKAAKKHFKTPLVFSIQEAKGLEYENIILYNMVSGNKDEFSYITKGITPDDLEDNLKYARAKDKEDKDLEVYKFFINSLYVAFTRSVKNLFIIEDNNSLKLFELLKLKESKENINIQSQKSNEEEWVEEARKLELQGKFEQARQIKDRLAGVKYISPEEYAQIREVALDSTKTEQEVKRERKDLFSYAVARKNFDDIDKLAELNFLRAVQFRKQLRQTQKQYEKACRLNRINEALPIIKKYGLDFVLNEENETGIFYAVRYANAQLFNFFIKNKANTSLINSQGLNPLQTAFLSSYKYEIEHDKDVKFDFGFLKQCYEKLKTNSLSYTASGKLFKINSNSMQYFLFNLFVALQDRIVENNNTKNGLTVNDILPYLEEMPESILPEYRKKRTYISSILSGNEVDRVFVYNKKVFKRIERGVYILNPDINTEL